MPAVLLFFGQGRLWETVSNSGPSLQISRLKREDLALGVGSAVERRRSPQTLSSASWSSFHEHRNGIRRYLAPFIYSKSSSWALKTLDSLKSHFLKNYYYLQMTFMRSKWHEKWEAAARENYRAVFVFEKHSREGDTRPSHPTGLGRATRSQRPPAAAVPRRLHAPCLPSPRLRTTRGGASLQTRWNSDAADVRSSLLRSICGSHARSFASGP